MAFISTFTNGALFSTVRDIVNSLSGRANATGWASYGDTQYTTGSPFALTGNNTWVSLPNNAGSVINDQLPQDVAMFYNAGTQKIIGQVGDGMSITFVITARPTTASDTYLELAINIGGSLGRIFPEIITFPKGNGVDRAFTKTVDGYSAATWAANGGQIEVRANANVQIFGISYVITRNHKAR